MDLTDLVIMAAVTLSVFVPSAWSILRMSAECSQIEECNQPATTIEL